MGSEFLSVDHLALVMSNDEDGGLDAEVPWDDSPVWGRMREVALGKAGVLREVCIDPGARTSLHFHHTTREVNVVVGGAVRMRYGPSAESLTDIVLQKGDLFVSEPGVVHVALFESPEDSTTRPWARIVEMILDKPFDQEDAVRIEPGRPGTK